MVTIISRPVCPVKSDGNSVTLTRRVGELGFDPPSAQLFFSLADRGFLHNKSSLSPLQGVAECSFDQSTASQSTSVAARRHRREQSLTKLHGNLGLAPVLE